MRNLELDRREEIAEFESFPEADQKWICFCLDMSHYPPKNRVEWGKEMGIIKSTSAMDVLSHAVIEFRAGGMTQLDHGFSGGIYPALIRAGAYARQWRHLRSYAAFRFLLERLFGGKVRSFIPSIFLALAAHPDADCVDHDQVEEALDAHRGGWGPHDCVTRPTFDFANRTFCAVRYEPSG